MGSVWGVRGWRGWGGLWKITSSMPWSSIICQGELIIFTPSHPHRHTPSQSLNVYLSHPHPYMLSHSHSLTPSSLHPITSLPPHPYTPSQSLHPGEPAVQLDLWSSSVTVEPRFSLFVVDTPKRKAKNGPFAIFIAPQGRWGDQYCGCNKVRWSVLWL